MFSDFLSKVGQLLVEQRIRFLAHHYEQFGQAILTEMRAGKLFLLLSEFCCTCCGVIGDHTDNHCANVRKADKL